MERRRHGQEDLRVALAHDVHRDIRRLERGRGQRRALLTPRGISVPSTQYPTLRYGHGAESVALQQAVAARDFGGQRFARLVGRRHHPVGPISVRRLRCITRRPSMTWLRLRCWWRTPVRVREINPEDAQSDVDGHQVRLATSATGTVTVTITVTAADGSATEYVLVVGHEDVPQPHEDDGARRSTIAATTLTYVRPARRWTRRCRRRAAATGSCATC